jgi:hypothetical protein
VRLRVSRVRSVVQSSIMRELPNAQNLGEAVSRVIESNRSDGYTPTRFIQATADGTAPNLLPICVKLIAKGETLEYLDSALRRFPMLLTLEDFVSRRGSEWGFDEATVETARARSAYFDQLAGGTRYR